MAPEPSHLCQLEVQTPRDSEPCAGVSAWMLYRPHHNLCSLVPCVVFVGNDFSDSAWLIYVPAINSYNTTQELGYFCVTFVSAPLFGCDSLGYFCVSRNN